MWYDQHFQSLVPRQKWHQERRNIQIGDVVLIYYANKTSPGSYRLGIVREIHTSKDDLVRTAVVEYSIIRELTRQQRDAYAGITRKKLTVPIQRLVLIVPREEQLMEADSTSEHHVRPEEEPQVGHAGAADPHAPGVGGDEDKIGRVGKTVQATETSLENSSQQDQGSVSKDKEVRAPQHTEDPHKAWNLNIKKKQWAQGKYVMLENNNV